jgi:hypothetical protein
MLRKYEFPFIVLPTERVFRDENPGQKIPIKSCLPFFRCQTINTSE